MNTATIATVSYGIISILGGISGYIKAKSKISLISGVISGVALIIAAFVQLQQFSFGSTMAQVITLLLIAVFAVRLIKTRKFMPAGLMLILGIITLICLFA